MFSWGQCWQMRSYLHLDNRAMPFYRWCPNKYWTWYNARCNIASQCVGAGESNLGCFHVIAVKWGASVCVELYRSFIWSMWCACKAWVLSNEESKAFICCKVTTDCLPYWWLTFQTSLSVFICAFLSVCVIGCSALFICWWLLILFL